MTREEDAKRVLVHYFHMALDAAGLKWQNDYQVELEQVIDDIIDAAVEKATTTRVPE